MQFENVVCQNGGVGGLGVGVGVWVGVGGLSEVLSACWIHGLV